MKKSRVVKTNKTKQKEATKKFILKKKVKAKPKKKAKKKKLITYTILVRNTRFGNWKVTPDKVTSSDKKFAAHIAASKNPNLWVKVTDLL